MTNETRQQTLTMLRLGYTSWHIVREVETSKPRTIYCKRGEMDYGHKITPNGNATKVYDMEDED